MLLRQHYSLFRRPDQTGPGWWTSASTRTSPTLYLAADVLVTDYSSAMFDVAVTGKPVLLWCYDLAHYRDGLRGFTLDLATQVPDPSSSTRTPW